VIADRGEYDAIPIHLEKSGESYSFRLGVRAGFGGGETARVPVSRRPNPAPHPILKEVHECEVAGQTLQAANVYALRQKVATLLEGIAPGRTLPLCYFRVPAMDYELPVYEAAERQRSGRPEGPGMLTSPVIGGPNLKADDMAGIRRVVCRYLESAGYVNDMDDVAVGVVRPRDLKRVEPAAVLRSATDSDLWIPTVEGVSEDGPVVGVVGRPAQLRGRARRRRLAGPELEDHAPAAHDIVGLLRYLRTELARAETAGAQGLYACEVRPDIWAAAEAHTEDAGTRLVAHLQDPDATRLELEVRRTGAGDMAVALEDRTINVFLAHDVEGLAWQVGSHLVRDDFLRFTEEVEIEAVEAPRAERLGVESIRSDGADAPEEVPAAWS
jgi:hypothetical protein